MDSISILMAFLLSLCLASSPCDTSAKGEAAVCVNSPAEDTGKQAQVLHIRGTKHERNNISNGF